MNEVTIFLTPPEALLFKDFQQYHLMFTLLCQQGVFDVRNGQVIINFGPTGEISTIERKDILYNSHINLQKN